LGKLSRNKGAVWEREVAAFLGALFQGAKRGVGQSRFGNNSADVEGTPFWVECKVGKTVNLRAALRQAEKETDGRVPVAVCKDNSVAGKSPEVFVVLRVADFLQLAKTFVVEEETVGLEQKKKEEKEDD